MPVVRLLAEDHRDRHEWRPSPGGAGGDGNKGGRAVLHDVIAFIFGDKGQVAIAGGLGGLVRWLTLRTHWLDGLISIIVGAICALYLGPLAEPAISAMVGTFVPDPTSRASFSGFIIGLGGISVAGLVMDLWQKRRRHGGG